MASLPSASRVEETYDNYNKAFHEYNEVSQTPENMKKLEAASQAVDALQKQRRMRYSDYFLSIRTVCPLRLLFLRILVLIMLMKLKKYGKQFDPSIRYCYALKQLEDLIQRGKELCCWA